MLRRAWYVICGLWALLLFGVLAADPSGSVSGGLLFLALGPFAVPLLLRWFFCFVLAR